LGQPAKKTERAASGVTGLDDILGGGLPCGRMYLVEGDPGAGKTTLALQFLLEGARAGEPCVYVSLSETEEELRSMAASHGWNLEGITICDLQSSDESLKAESQYTLFHPSDVELSDTTRVVLEAVERVTPRRIVFDSLSEMRLLARDPLRYRRQVLALKTYFSARDCTVILLDYQSIDSGERQLHSLCHGVLALQQLTPEYGGQRRRLRIQKLRGVSFRDGYHDYRIRRGGLSVFPRLVAAEHRHSFSREPLTSDLPDFDRMMGGGLDRGTSTLFLGPAGVGKSTLASQCIMSALNKGKHAAIYAFDEVPGNLLTRAEGLGMDFVEHAASGALRLRQIDPAELSPGEFADYVREDVESHQASVILIDSLNGYRAAMPEEQHLSAHLHELLSYLNQQGVVTMLIVAEFGIFGETVAAPMELSYLADSVVLLRYFEADGEVRKAVSVVKKRTGSHERVLREFLISSDGLRMGRQLKGLDGLLRGSLVYTGEHALAESTHGQPG